MFDQLPETIPYKNKRKFKVFGAAFAMQAVLVAGLIIVQMMLPEKLGQFQLIPTIYMAPPPPPPPAPVSAAPKQVQHAAPKTPWAPESTAALPRPEPVQKEPEVIAPTAVPKDIARIVESSPPTGAVSGNPVGGVHGGIPGGIAGGALEGVLGATTAPVSPPPPTEPVRVGGNVKAPKPVHVEQPQYPPAAKTARVEGVVVVEAIVTADGSVEKVKVISGPSLLTDAAAQAVSGWKYEPTYLNGQAVPVILTATINFSLNK